VPPRVRRLQTQGVHHVTLVGAHRIRTERGDYEIAPVRGADAIEALVTRSTGSLSDDRSARDPHRR